MSENSKSKVVGSVTEFLSCIIIGTEKEQLSSNFYYRGESKEFPRRVPTFYRDDYGEVLVEKGSEYYYRLLISELGYIDYNDSFSLFQLLSELQHYEGKTRMLDVSSNPLVALFFATADNANDGYVYLFKEEKYKEKFDTGQTIAIKSALNFIDSNKIDTFISIMESIKNLLERYEEEFEYRNITELLESVELVADALGSKIVELLPINAILDSKFDHRVVQYDLSEEEEFMRVIKNKIEEFVELIQQRAKLWVPIRYPSMIYYALKESYIVLSSKRTDRLRQQQGAFIYPCFTRSNKSFDVVQEEVHNSIVQKAAKLDIGGEKYSKIKIPKESKKHIRKELVLIGIDEGFIYPDIKNRSKSLLNRLSQE